MRGETHGKITRRLGKACAASLFAFLAVTLFSLLVFALLGADSVVDALRDKNFCLLHLTLDGIVALSLLLMHRVDAQSIAADASELEDTSWLTARALRKKKEFSVYGFDAADRHSDGIVIGAERKSRRCVEIVSTAQLHALIVGTTGSGKTTGFVDQNISVLARNASAPCLIITDPKRELYARHAKQLEALGYAVSVMDLREPHSSIRWNPMNVLVRRIRILREIEYRLEARDGKYFAGGETFASYGDAKTRAQNLRDEIFDNAHDLVYTLCPIRNKDQPTWEDGARNLILGFVLAFCEDCLSGKIEEKRLLLFNVYHNITKYCAGDASKLKEYLLEGRDEYSKVRGLANAVLVTSDRTLASFLSDVNGYMRQLTDDGIMALTSENELDLLSFDERKNAVFIVIPDERFTRHRFVTLFITQLYKELVEKANLNFRALPSSGAKLKRNAYFVLDEFGNLPKFENIEGMVTVARSRGIRFAFVIQSYSQLRCRYGKDVSDIIKSNCNVKIFIGTDDQDTRREFSELCGQKKIKSVSISTNLSNNPSSTVGAANRALITPGQLERLNGDEKGDAIVSVRGYEPIRSKFTPSYLLPAVYFPVGPLDEPHKAGAYFDKDKYAYDIDSGSVSAKLDAITASLSAIGKAEDAEAAIMSEMKARVRGLRGSRILSEIDSKLDGFLELLDDSDRKAVLESKLEDKPAVLYSLMDEYDSFYAGEIMRAADFVSQKIRELSALDSTSDEA